MTVQIQDDAASALAEAIRQLVTLEHGRQARADQLWANIATNVTHTGYLASATSLDVASDTSNLVRYTQVVAALPASSTGLLTIAGSSMPLPAGVTSFSCSILCGQYDTKNLTSTVTGPMALWLMGELAPTYSALT